ncbi:MAG: rhomboid family intramembrane serine protease [Betaproteobacteria bacterium]|nr:rhomboid family intramembrane serine protease [Betaproteobacteria bacterium]
MAGPDPEEFVWRLARATPRLWVTQLIIGLNVAVWLLNLLGGVSPMSPDARSLLAWGGNFLPFTLEQPWRLFTCTLLHGGIVHLAFNMWALWDTGRVAERFYGNTQFLLIYLGAGLIGSLASLFFAASRSVSVGASGAIFGVVGALLSALFTKHHKLPAGLVKSMRSSMLIFVGYSLVMGVVSGHIDNAAHIGGLLGGFGMAVVMAERFDWEEFHRAGLVRAMLAVAGACAVMIILWKLLPTGAA